MTTVLGIDHINIVVADLERSARFYTEHQGLRRSFERILEGPWLETVTGIPGARAHCLFLEAGDCTTRLELLQFLPPTDAPIPANSVPNTPGMRHVAFNVPNEELTPLVERLRAAGVQLVSDPVEVPFIVGNLGRKRLCYFLDPDGTIVEVAAYG